MDKLTQIRQVSELGDELGEPHPHEIVRCMACGRTLTDADSRRRRIGPDCSKKLQAAMDKEGDDGGYDPDEVD